MTKSNSPATILLIDDDEAVLTSFVCFFEDCGYNVLQAQNGREGLAVIKSKRPDLVFTDLLMPEMGGLELIASMKELCPEIPVVVISGIGVVGDAIKAVKMGAWDYITKPVYSLSELEIIARRALEAVELRREVSALSNNILSGQLNHQGAFSSIITQDEGMRRIFQYSEAIAPTNQPVLVTGQTGTGKELIARALHDVSGRKGSFIAVNVGGVDDMVFSDTLFGHVKGAFTGADRARDGMIAQAAGGTLFLDEIGDMSDASQIKLLRLLQEQEYFQLGSDRPLKTTARIIAATNRDLRSMVTEGTFRQDLFYRLCTHQIQLPSLAQRKADIPLLLKHFIDEAAAALGKIAPVPSPELYNYLPAYAFPGNIRELKAMVFDSVARHSRGVLSKESFLEAMGNQCPASSLPTRSASAVTDFFGHWEDRLPTLKEAEEALIQKALELAHGNQGAAARYLGITRQGLNKIINRKKNLSPTK
ncbi:MAG TPA: sigma-54 dependent transcriptional regulator [Desulfuromonadaceae bacterium]|jgi:DNA-binding NtrC family response regulator